MENQQTKMPENDDYIGNHKILKRRDARNAALLKMAHEAMVMDKIMRQNKIVENTVKGLQNESGINTSNNPNSEGEDVGVSIGNEHKVENHYHQQLPVQETSKSSGWQVPAAILAAGALTGAGMYYGQKQEVPPVNEQEIVMPESDIGVGFGQPVPIINDGF